MITFSKSPSRLLNFENIKSLYIPDLIKFEAIDTINNYDFYKDFALKNNLCTTSYTNSETDKIPGKLGCNLSYLSLFKEICSLYNDEEWVLILEDDIKIDSKFIPFAEGLIPQLKGLDTEYVSLYVDPAITSKQLIEENKISKDLFLMIPQYYTLAQLVKISGAKKILDSCPIDENIDFWRNNNISFLSATIAHTNSINNGGSTNSETHKLNSEDSLGSLIWDSKIKKNPDQILFQMHIMWYESKMVRETLDSLQAAIQKSSVPIKVVLGLNSQTYIEEPTTGDPSTMFEEFLDHPIINSPTTTCYNITNEQPFYNIGDWRREVYNPNALYTVWGESDCLIPSDYFKILSSTHSQIPYNHFITLASRKMWDASWDIVEHPHIRQYPRGKNREDIDDLYSQVPSHLASEKQITYTELEDFNKNFEPIVKKLPYHKVDGSLLAISKNFPRPFIGEKVRFAREDTCFENFCRIKGIPQFIVETKIKGHNYKHPLKRENTKSLRSDEIYRSYEQKSIEEINIFLSKELQKVKDQKVKEEKISPYCSLPNTAT